MKLSISNIGWAAGDDLKLYTFMKKYGYSGLEIAPTRIFPENPYDRLAQAREWSENLKKEYGFEIPSMQSIWYGRQEKLFGSREERQSLIAYTKKGIDFANAIGCGNLVFGCPRNRVLPDGVEQELAVAFFKEIGDYAVSQGTVIGMEANPPIYNTNYINDTLSALDLIRQVDSKGFLLNLDVGTMIQNVEDISELDGNIQLINHVHISEPNLKPIEERPLHMQLKQKLVDGGYKGYVSIEMGKTDDVSVLEEKMRYIEEVFQ